MNENSYPRIREQPNGEWELRFPAEDGPQRETRATICGHVTNGEGERIDDVLLVITDTSTSAIESQCQTDDSGEYAVGASPDTYDVRAFHAGYVPAEQTAVTIREGETVTVNLTLSRTPSADSSQPEPQRE